MSRWQWWGPWPSSSNSLSCHFQKEISRKRGYLRMPKIDRVGDTYVQYVFPSPGAPREGKGGSVEMKATCLKKQPPENHPEVQCPCRCNWSPWGTEGRIWPLLRSCRSCPIGTLGGLACVHVQGFQAVLTAHGTAPVEFTLTLGHPGDMGCVIASPTTHNFAAVHASGSQVAHAACCTQGAWKTSQRDVTGNIWAEYNRLWQKRHEAHPWEQSLASLPLSSLNLWIAAHVVSLCSWEVTMEKWTRNFGFSFGNLNLELLLLVGLTFHITLTGPYMEGLLGKHGYIRKEKGLIWVLPLPTSHHKKEAEAKVSFLQV